MTGPRLDERGMGSVLALALIATVLMATAGVVALGTARVVRHKAAVAADAAALAAAGATLTGEARACALAERAAALGGARLVGCRITGDVADVEVEMRPPSWFPVAGVARLNARAGPAETDHVIDANRDKATRLDHPS